MTALIWRDIENNKVYVKYGLETIEVPHAIAEAYRQEEAKDFCLIYSEVDSLKVENAKLRELVVRMFHTIEWSDRMSGSMYCPSFSYERELRELGIEVG